MMINNPNRNIRLIDLLDMFSDNLHTFNYNDIYEIVGNWLSSEAQYLVTGVDYEEFIEMFCDRYFRRCLNFDTSLDFKIALRNTLKKYREKARRMYEAGLLEIDPLQTYFNASEHIGHSDGETKGKSTNSGSSKDTSEVDYTTSNKNYHLHTDTPSDSVKVSDLFSTNSNFITDASNDSSVSTNKSNKDERNNNYNNVGSTENNYKNNDSYRNKDSGYTGVPSELLEKYVQLNLDVVNFYMDMIEKEALFSNVLY